MVRLGYRIFEGPGQKYIYLSDGANEKVHILLRDTLQI